MARPSRKQALRVELLTLLTEALASAQDAHRAALEGATHAESKPENDKDTRATEASYLARGQAKRVEELEAGVAELGIWVLRSFGDDDAVGLGALVTIEEDDQQRQYLIAPHGGGLTLDGGAVHVVTPHAPLGRALLGKRAGDDCEVRLTGRTRTLAIVSVT